jgi:hypothetical protein
VLKVILVVVLVLIVLRFVVGAVRGRQGRPLGRSRADGWRRRP